MKKSKLLIPTISLLALVLFIGNLHPIQKAYAASDNLSTSITWDGNCNDDIYDNGSTTAYAYYASGDTVNLTVNNNSSEALEIGIKGQSPTPVSANSSAPVTISLEDEAVIAVYSNSCSQANDSNLYIFGESGSTSCSLQSKVWNVTVDYDGVEPSVSLYRGSTYVDILNDTSGGPGGGNVNTTVQFAGESSSATYYVYNGSNSSSPLIGQATCSAIPAAPTTTTSTPKSSTTPTASTPNTSNSSNTSTPATSNTKTPNTNSTSSDSKKSISTPKKISSSNTSILIGAGLGVLLIVVAIVVLGVLGTWNAPQHLLKRVWKLLRKHSDKETPSTPTKKIS